MAKFTPKLITDTIEENYMPYVMSVIVSRAIPEIDGFKPSHRKLLYTMYKMGLLTGGRTKSANIVGETMKLNPHGDGPIYETMVRLTKGREALLNAYIDSKGTFGKHYSTDAYAASRYTQAKLDKFCEEIFKDIDKDTVDFVDNYDGTTTEPTLFPVTFPNILVAANQGIAVGMASNISSFNLKEICETTIELIKNPEHNIHLTLPAPDFSTGAKIIYDANVMKNVYNTGVGSIKIQSKYTYDKKNNCIEVYEIPYTTTIQAISDKIVELVKSGKIKDITNVSDLIDFNGFKLTIDLKRGTDPDKLMQKLFKMTTLEDTFACNFNVLIGGVPRVLGIKDLLNEWLAFRIECIKRGLFFDINKKKERLHLLLGLQKILLDIDKAIQIIRQTEDEDEVVPNLMIGFSIDEIQAEFVADIRLRNINKEYILNKISEIDNLYKEIADFEDLLNNPKRINKRIIDELQNTVKKYGKERKTEIVYDHIQQTEDFNEEIEDYSVTLFLSESGYFKKITAQSLRMSGEHKYKENDKLLYSIEAQNISEILFFTSKQQVYKCKAYEFEDTKASVLGDYLPQKLGLEQDETIIYMTATIDFSGHLLIFFQNGKAAKIEFNVYETKLNRKKLINAYSNLSKPIAFFNIKEDCEFVLTASNNRTLIIDSRLINPKTTKNTAGVNGMTLKAKTFITSVKILEDGMFINANHYKTKNIPAAGSFLKNEDTQIPIN